MSTHLEPDPVLTDSEYPIIAHCHLSWDWVWQRPQQFLSRLAKRHPVLFVEMAGPVGDIPAPRYTLRMANVKNVIILRMEFPSNRWGDGEFVDNERRRLVKEAIADFFPEKFRRPVQWFYDPMAVTAFAGKMGEIANVYDCMDELSQFKNPPPNIADRERELLQRADVVFTGGRRLFESKSRFNANCHFYGGGVDTDHFGLALLEDFAPAPEAMVTPSPRLGYIGVIDERLDLGLIDYLAEKDPGWSILMVGPVCKIDPTALPRRQNIHWLGGQPYARLPHFAKAFDLCLMPFALNEATEYINPTKTLEYLATGHPVVSTPVADVVSNFGTVVHIASDPASFEEACHDALAYPDARRRQHGLALAADNTWDRIVAKLENHVREALESKRRHSLRRERRRPAQEALTTASV